MIALFIGLKAGALVDTARTSFLWRTCRHVDRVQWKEGNGKEEAPVGEEVDWGRVRFL